MEKFTFEATDGGIAKGDLIMVVAPREFFSPLEAVTAFCGLYSPIEDANHPYVQKYKKEISDWDAKLVGKVFLLDTKPTIDYNRLDLGIHDYSTEVWTFRYANCRSVQLLLKADLFQRFLWPQTSIK